MPIELKDFLMSRA
jgi:hypothetical protein